MLQPCVVFGVILFSCGVTRASAFLLRGVNCLACVDCLRRGVGSLRLQLCSEVAVRLTSLMLFHSLYENRQLQAAPPSFLIGSPPGWVMGCLPHTRNCCTFSIGLSSISRTTRNPAGETAQDRRHCDYCRHPPQPRSIVSFQHLVDATNRTL